MNCRSAISEPVVFIAQARGRREPSKWCHVKSKYFLHALHRYFPSVVLFGINVAFVVVHAMLIERPTQPTITYAVSAELQ
jgi:hypothetical protein